MEVTKLPYKIRTIEELERVAYGVERSQINKGASGTGAAGPTLRTDSSGVSNWIYGAYAWSQVNQEANLVGVLPKTAWDRSGWRMMLDKAGDGSDAIAAAADGTANYLTEFGGTPEGGKLGAAKRPNFAQEYIIPKIIQLPFQSTTVREWLSQNGSDDFWGQGLEGMRLIMAVRHKELMNEMLLADVEESANDANTAGDATDSYSGNSNNWETLDRIISSTAEEKAILTDADVENFYNPWHGEATIDRSSTNTLYDNYDCTVNSASGTIGTNGNLTDDNIRKFRMDIMKRSGADSTVYVGSYEVYNEIQGIYTSQVRYDVLGESTASIDVNGISTFNGIGVGIHVQTLYGIPYIPTKDATKNADDSDEVGRMYALDTQDREGYGFPRIGMQIAIPTTYNEIGRGMTGWPFTTDAFVEDALYWTMGETFCRSFKSQGQLRDIKV